MSFRQRIRDRAAALARTVVLAEGWDSRVRQAAKLLESSGVANVILVEESIQDERADMVAELFQSRKPDLGVAEASRLARQPMYFAAGLVALGEADAAVGGAVYPTPEVIRAALLAVGPAPGVTIVSSSFYMALDRGERVLTFTDAGVVPDPSPPQLAEIAMTAARDRPRIVGDEPRVAFLSYSTKGSAAGPRVERVTAALRRFKHEAPQIVVDGELQGDAALAPEVAGVKAPGSPVAGDANVLVFPDLDSGNIAYKLVQRLARATATGPILQGLARPVVDLSRGADVQDVVDVAAVAILQAGYPLEEGA